MMASTAFSASSILSDSDNVVIFSSLFSIDLNLPFEAPST